MQTNQPFVLVIFGATGDLARHKLYPALFSLFQMSHLPEQCYIVGFSRRKFTHEEFRAYLTQEMQELADKEQNVWEKFLHCIYYQEGNFNEKTGYEELIGTLNNFDQQVGACLTRIFYLATPPDNYTTILENLKTTKLSEGCGQGSDKWTRIAIEKPFGKNLETAKALDQKLSEIFQERQIFRVDHYLGKETIQNLLTFRFANSIFEPIWNKNYIDHVQITFAEKKGIAGRGAFFDGVGLLRDVAQNHLMQVVAAIAMEQPMSFTKDSVRDARAKAIASIKSISPKEISTAVVRGQYAGYLEEGDVAENSQTETFVAMKFSLDSKRFEDVPFYLRAGKKMPDAMVEVSVVFKQTCHILFKEYGCPEVGNVLTFRIQPDEGIIMRVIAKKPGNALSLDTANLRFSYAEEFEDKVIDAYEKLLLDIFSADQMLFNRSDELESSWEFMTAILLGWTKSNQPVIRYESGTWGPLEAQELIEKDGRKWL